MAHAVTGRMRMQPGKFFAGKARNSDDFLRTGTERNGLWLKVLLRAGES